MRNLIKLSTFFVIIAFFLNSCGYRLNSAHSFLPDRIKTVYIENPKNSTNEPNINVYLRNAIIQDLKLEPNVAVVSDKSQAQGYIKTNIINYYVGASAYNSSGFASMYSCTITINLTLVDKNGKKLIYNKTLTSSMDFSALSDINANEEAKLTISKKVMSDLASLIREELFINF